MNKFYGLISRFIPSIWLSLVSIARLPYCYFLKSDFRIEYFVLGFPFAVSGLQNCVRWKVNGANRVTINGVVVNPSNGEIVFTADSVQKFVLNCSNGSQRLEREITVASYSYQQKLDLNYTRYAPVPVFSSERITQDLLKQIPQDLNPLSLNSETAQKAIQKANASIGDKQLDRLCSKKLFESIHDNFIQIRLSYDKNYDTALSEIFKNKEVPVDYKKQITSYTKTIINQNIKV